MDGFTLETTEASFYKADESAIFLNLPGRKIFRVDDKVVKFGSDVNIQEAEAMSFVANAIPDIPVPKVFQSLTNNGTTIIEMELIQGVLLQEMWPALSYENKRDLASQVKIIVDKLRSIQGTYIGSCERGPALDMRRAVAKGGPFDCEADFNTFLLSNVASRTPQIHRQMLQSVMSSEHKLVLTHGDLSPRNIVVKGGRIVGLLDWEGAGFYPEHWEFVQFFRAIDSSTDWHEFANDIFTTTYPIQYMIDQFLGRLTKH